MYGNTYFREYDSSRINHSLIMLMLQNFTWSSVKFHKKKNNLHYHVLFCSARELELEDRQGRLQQQLRDSMSLEGRYWSRPNC